MTTRTVAALAVLGVEAIALAVYAVWAVFKVGGQTEGRRKERRMAEDVRPFSNGTEADVWRSRNCERCALNKYDRFTNDDEGTCPMERAVALGYITGTVPARLAIEYGAELHGRFASMPRECPKLVLIQKCEFIRWPKTRRAKKCGAPATGEVMAHGARRAVCDHHQKRCAAMDAAEQKIPTHHVPALSTSAEQGAATSVGGTSSRAERAAQENE